jgi:hypothetical protein
VRSVAHGGGKRRKLDGSGGAVGAGAGKGATPKRRFTPTTTKPPKAPPDPTAKKGGKLKKRVKVQNGMKKGSGRRSAKPVTKAHAEIVGNNDSKGGRTGRVQALVAKAVSDSGSDSGLEKRFGSDRSSDSGDDLLTLRLTPSRKPPAVPRKGRRNGPSVKTGKRAAAGSGSFVCEVSGCGKAYVRRHGLTTHVRKVHSVGVGEGTSGSGSNATPPAAFVVGPPAKKRKTGGMVPQLHYTTLLHTRHCTTLHYPTLHYPALHTLHYTVLHCTTLLHTRHCTTLHYTPSILHSRHIPCRKRSRHTTKEKGTDLLYMCRGTV